MLQNINSINMYNVNRADYESIDYPMTTKYSQSWARWEVAREIISNALDTKTEVKVYMQDGDFITEDIGESGILPLHLLLGESHKLDDEAIGQFGEGLKLAFLVCLKMGFEAEIMSKNYHYILGTSIIAKTEVLSIAYYEYDHILFNGTRVIVHNWNSTELFLDNFIFDHSVYNHSNEHGGVILDNKYRGKIFVRGVFVQDNASLALGYNLNNLTMSKGRSTIQDYQILDNIGKVLSNCQDFEVWNAFFYATKNDRMESLITSLYPDDDNTREYIKRGFYSVFGDNVLIGTSQNMMNQALHLGRESIFGDKFGRQLMNLLSYIVGYDEQFVINKLGQPFEIISSHKIDDNQKLTLKYIRKLSDKLGFDRKHIRIAGYGADFAGQCNGDYIYLKDHLLNSLSDTIGVFIHEMAHFNTGADDLTDTHIHEIQRLSGILLESYMIHGK